MALEAIKWEGGKLHILDQLLLPHELKYIDVRNTHDGWKVINKMQVRGAPAIAIVGCLSLAAELYGLNENLFTSYNIHEMILEKLSYLETARPTAVNMKKCAFDLKNFSSSLIEEDLSVQEFIQKIIDWCVNLLEEDISVNINLSIHGCQTIQRKFQDKKLIMLTHCNTGSLATAGYGTALGVIRKLFEANLIDHVYCTETRPYNQGARLTAYELVHEKIPSSVICDNMVGALMKIKGCHAVVVGADRVTRNGDTANKIGTYQLAVIAKYHKVPFYVCAPTSSIDLSLPSGSDIPIEERPPEEMTSIAGIRIAAPGIGCWNPAFDVTPAELITGGIVTERGVFNPGELFDQLSS